MPKDKNDDCPRGFHWCTKREKCIPDEGGVDQKLEQRYQRYFFKEDITMKDIDKLVDEAFAGGFTTFAKQRKVEKKVDRILDSFLRDPEDDMISTSGRPYDAPIQMRVVATVDGKAEISKENVMGAMKSKEGFDDSEYDDGPEKPDNPQKLSNDINTVPNQNPKELLKSVRDELSEGMVWKIIAEMRKDEGYKKYFTSMMKKHGYNSPADIPADKKKDFFNAVDAGWKAANEQFIRPSGGPKTYGGGIGVRGSSTQGGFGSIRGTSSSGGFGTIKGRSNEQDDMEDDEIEEKCKK